MSCYLSETLKEFGRWLCKHSPEQGKSVDVKGTMVAKIFRWSKLFWSRNRRKLEGPGDEKGNGKRNEDGEQVARTHRFM